MRSAGTARGRVPRVSIDKIRPSGRSETRRLPETGDERGVLLTRQANSPRYSDSSTRSLMSDWYSTWVSCSIVRQVLPSAARR